MFNMEHIELYSSFFLLFILAIKLLHQTRARHNNLPPCPPTLPILGHLHIVRELSSQFLFTLSKKHGPIFSLQLGSRRAVVISSASAVKECFTKNDIILANRPNFWVGKYIGYDYTSLAMSHYGEHWRKLRRIWKLETFSTNQLNLSSSILRDEIKILLQKLYRASSQDNFLKVKLKPMLSKLVFNITMRMFAGKQYNNSGEEVKLHKLIQELLKLGISPNTGDVFPSLWWADFQGYKKNFVKLAREIDVLLQDVIDEYRRNKGVFEKENTMISRLLSLQESQPQHCTDEIIKGIVQDALLGGSNISITLEWTMSHLLNNLNVLEKSEAELNFHVGHDKLLDEADLSKLPYLQNIISETFGLNPPVPFLIPHASSDHCNIGGYAIPKDTMLLVNTWAIHRDPKLWDEATSFKPERFENGRIEGYKLMPFGLGRRSCPGMNLSRRVAGLALGSLIQCFEWKRESAKKIDMTEGKGLNLTKVEPLQALYKARYNARKLLS